LPLSPFRETARELRPLGGVTALDPGKEPGVLSLHALAGKVVEKAKIVAQVGSRKELLPNLLSTVRAHFSGKARIVYQLQ
jgi:hypothetical protein